MRDNLLIAATAMTLAVALYRTWLLISGPRTPARWCVASSVWSLGIGLGFGISVVYVGFDELVGVPNLARLVRHVGGVTAIFAGQLMYVHLDASKPSRRPVVLRGVFWIIAITAMTVLFALAPVDGEEPVRFTDVYAASPWIPPYMTVYLGYLAVGASDQIVRARRYARAAEGRIFVRAASNMYAAGLGVAAVYISFKAGVVTAAQFGHQLPFSETLVTTVVLVVAVCTANVGTLFPVVGPRLVSVRRVPRRYRLYRQLHPLWLACYQGAEHVVLDPPKNPTRDALPLKGLHDALYRRIIEIFDGMRAVRPYADPSVTEIATTRAREAGLAGGDLDAVVQAAQFAVAFDAKRNGRSIAGGASTESGAQCAEPRRAAANTDTEAARLAAIAQAFTGSPIVTDIRSDYAAMTRSTSS